MGLFEDFASKFDMNAIAEDCKNASEQKEFVKKDVPYGNYEVKVSKLELQKHPFDDNYKDMPELVCWFKIIGDEFNGEYKNQTLFVTKRLLSLNNPKSGFLIHKANELLDSLESGIPVVFEDFNQYEENVKAIFNAIDGVAEYQLAYTEDAKGYKSYEIVQKF